MTLLEQGATIPADTASSTDVAKGVRRIWYHPDYVDLAEAALRGWLAWETRTGSHIFWRTGGLTLVRELQPGSVLHDSYQLLVDRGAPVEIFAGAQLHQRFPQFVLAAGYPGDLRSVGRLPGQR